MSEDFIHFVWKFRLFNKNRLSTIKGEPVEIISPGVYNRDGGPDFSNAKIRIGETLWMGNVEIHIHSSDWDKHRHTEDKAYNNVILHAVYLHDKQIFRSDGTEPPAVELKDYIKAGIEKRYDQLIGNLTWIPCEKQIRTVEDIYIRNWLSRVLAERLEEKSSEALKLVNECKGSWDDAFYILLARNFGFKINALPFELLAKSLSRSILAKHKNSPLQTEALLFGQAGFLGGNYEDDYSRELAAEYEFLRKKYKLLPIDVFLWKFLRLRPMNFPALRLAQFAGLILNSNHLFSKIIEINDIKTLTGLFKDIPVNPYWEKHYIFGRLSAKKSVQLGADSMNNILINTVGTTIFAYGKFTGSTTLTDRAVSLLESLPAETNHVIRGFKDIGVSSGSAAESQALLQLKKSWCDKKNCLLCAVGAKIINYG